MRSRFLLFFSILLLDAFAHDCGTHDPLPEEVDVMEEGARSLFGTRIRDMTSFDFSQLFAAFQDERREGQYTLVDIPMVYHILPNQDNGGSGSPSATDAQLAHMTEVTNRLFNIYDKATGLSVQFASFVKDETVVHPDIFNQDCGRISRSQLNNLVRRVSNWQFKMHTLICESRLFSGRATLPSPFSALDDPQQNMVIVEYRAIGCRDDADNFLCELSDGEEISHARWWRSGSSTLAHEIGHSFGLQHTFSLFCFGIGDNIADTPHHTGSEIVGCQGLLPYDRDRNMFGFFNGFRNNRAEPEDCVGELMCGNTCAACCNSTRSRQCDLYVPGNSAESVTEDDVDYPTCCNLNNVPTNTCPLRPGIDPLNNVMAYSPDFCVYEFTPGQMASMMATVRQLKVLLYCNYASLLDEEICSTVECGPDATSPNCV